MASYQHLANIYSQPTSAISIAGATSLRMALQGSKAFRHASPLKPATRRVTSIAEISGNL